MNWVLTTLSESASARFGSAIALVTDERTLTFDEVNDEVARFAGGLAKLGLNAGDRVILHLANQWEWVIAYYAVARAGAVVIPANFLLSAEEVAYISRDSQAIAIIAPIERCLKIKAFDSVDVKHYIYLGQDECVGTAVDGHFEAFGAMMTNEPLEPVIRQPDDLFSICYTSGTTGNPKGAMLSHRAVYMSTALTSTMHVRHEGERVVSALPFTHVYGNVVLHSCFMAGMTLITTQRFDAGWALEAIEHHRATLFEGVPTMYYYMLGHPTVAMADLSSLRRCTVGGQNLPSHKHKEIEQTFGCPLLELWGMTELAGPAISPYITGPKGAVGRALPGIEVKIVSDSDPHTEMSLNTPGELLVRGPTVMCGYYGNSKATQENLLEQGWLRTGDIATVDAAGYVHIVDRLKDMIITAGYKIYPAEIEQVIASHAAISMVAVTSVRDDIKGELSKAFIVLRPQMCLTETEVLDFCRRELAAYKVPKFVEFLDSLPTTPSGKILRRHLRT
jgi:long-chain acyl-CoA synthetase